VGEIETEIPGNERGFAVREGDELERGGEDAGVGGEDFAEGGVGGDEAAAVPGEAEAGGAREFGRRQDFGRGRGGFEVDDPDVHAAWFEPQGGHVMRIAGSEGAILKGSMAYQRILYAVEGPIARITLNRPQKRNALDGLLIGELRAALREAEADGGLRVVALQGAGKDFCAGADLDALRRSMESSPVENVEEARRLADLFLALRRHRLPVVALVEGNALAGGCGLATACDVILAAESARFGYPEVNLGFLPAMVMAILRRSVSERRAFEWIVSGRIFSAGEAAAAGLVNHVYADAAFADEAAANVRMLASKSASAVTLAKRLLYQMDTMGIEAALEVGAQANAIARTTEDCRTGVERFLRRTGSRE
jgi:methylglutaconyl-CoA hydratase